MGGNDHGNAKFRNMKIGYWLALVALGLAGCEETPPAQKAVEIRPVRTTVVALRAIDDSRQAIGDIRARFESDLGFQVGGKIVARSAEIGALVKKGDVLARLDDQDFRNRLRAAEADVGSAEASFTEASSAEGRQRQLLQTGNTTQARHEEAIRNLRSTEAKLQSARANLNLARDQLSYTVLRADWDGIVTAVGAEPGQVVNVGQVVVKLAQPKIIDAVFALAEGGMRTPPTNLTVEVSLLADPSVVAAGTVREVSPVADPVTRTYTVKVALKDPPAEFRLGSSVIGRIRITSEPVIVLPATALFQKNSSPAVWLYVRSSSSVVLRPVAVLRYETDRIVIASGLAPGDIVVTAGVNKLREGQKVRLNEGAAK